MLTRSFFILANTLLPAAFLSLSLYAFSGAVQSDGLPLGLTWKPGPGPVELSAAVAACVGIYWILRAVGQSLAAFWLIAAVGLIAQAPYVLSHNILDWTYFLSRESLFAVDATLFESTALFLLSVAALVMLHKFIELRDDQRILAARQADASDIDRLIFGRSVASVALITSCTFVTLATLYVGGAIAGWIQPVAASSWTVLAIGVGSIVLMGLLPYLWLGGRSEE